MTPKPTPPAANTRQLTIGLKAGDNSTINLFRVTVSGKIVLDVDGTQSRKWNGPIADKNVPIEIEVQGASGTYKLSVDLPGMLDKQSLEISLVNGYSDVIITL